MGVIVGFKEDLEKAKAELEKPRPKSPAVPFVLNGKFREVVFYRCEPVEWSVATRKHPPRSDVPLDLRNGYDVSEVAREVSPSCGRLIEGGDEQELSAEEWADLWSVFDPTTARTIEANVWALHEHDHEQEIAKAKKASAPRSRRKSN